AATTCSEATPPAPFPVPCVPALPQWFHLPWQAPFGDPRHGSSHRLLQRAPAVLRLYEHDTPAPGSRTRTAASAGPPVWACLQVVLPPVRAIVEKHSRQRAASEAAAARCRRNRLSLSESRRQGQEDSGSAAGTAESWIRSGCSRARVRSAW